MHRDRRVDRTDRGALSMGGVALAADPFQPASAVGTVATAVAILAVLGVGIAVVYRSRSGPSGGSPEGDASTGPTADDSVLAFEKRIGEATLDRLEPTAPDAVERARELVRESEEGAPAAERVDRIERELRRGIEEALAEGRFDVTVTSPYGEPYEIVNLPSRYREAVLPPSGDTVHVRDLESTLEEYVADSEVEVRELAMAIETVRDHRAEIETYLERRESRFENRREEIEEDLANVRALADRLDGSVRERVEEMALESRHETVDGVVAAERRLEEATRALHRCRFEEVERALGDAQQIGERLLVTVDFLGGLIATIEHRGDRVDVPDEVPTELLADLAPVIERQYGVTTEVREDRILIEETETVTDDPPEGTEQRATNEVEAGRVDLGTVADEALYVLRELDEVADEGGRTIEYQTERLPESIGRPDVLAELTAFCRRQTDLVETAELQEGAPPGFLTLRFADRTTASRGIETLQDRFTERYAD